MEQSYTILLVDDDAALRQSLTYILRKAGYGVTAAAGPEEGLQALKAGPFDLILTDLRMPGMDGLDFLKSLREDHPSTPVIILTAHGGLNTAIEAMRHGASDYLLKPVKPNELLARLTTVLSKSQHWSRRMEIEEQLEELLRELRSMDTPARLKPPEPQPGHLTAPAADSPLSTRILQRGPFLLDLLGRVALMNGVPLQLSPTGFEYLAALLRRTPQPVSYEDLVREVQGYEVPRKEAQALARWQIHQLRLALEPDPAHPRYILNERGLGYRLALPL